MKSTLKHLFDFDPIQSELRKRRIKVAGRIVAVSLENCFWDVLSELAAGRGTSTDELIADILAEHLKAHQTYEDREAVLRCTCLSHTIVRQ